MAALAGPSGRVLAKSISTQCRNKDLADTVVVGPTARLAATAGNLPEVDIHRRVALRAAVVTLRVAARHQAATDPPVILRPVAGPRRAMVRHSPATADILVRLPVAPQVSRPRRAKP